MTAENFQYPPQPLRGPRDERRCRPLKESLLAGGLCSCPKTPKPPAGIPPFFEGGAHDRRLSTRCSRRLERKVHLRTSAFPWLESPPCLGESRPSSADWGHGSSGPQGVFGQST